MRNDPQTNQQSSQQPNLPTSANGQSASNGSPADTASNSLIAWARLLRVANVPTAWTNVLVAFLFAHGSWTPVGELLLLLLASSCLFCGGMVLNDVFDFKVDSIERPNRPIPAGVVSLAAARSVAIGLLFLGIVFATAAGALADRDSVTELSVWLSPITRSLICSLALVLSIWLYDGPLKKTWLAPLAMGSCRFFNILLGASTVSSGMLSSDSWFGFPSIVVAWAAAVGLLIAGVTLLARGEASENMQGQPGVRARLGIAATLVVAGLVGIAGLAWLFPNLNVQPGMQKWFPAFVALISWRMIRNVFKAFMFPSPGSIKRGVISILQSLIILDAVVSCLAVPNSISYSLVVLAMLVPVLWLGKRIPIT